MISAMSEIHKIENKEVHIKWLLNTTEKFTDLQDFQFWYVFWLKVGLALSVLLLLT